MIICVHILSLCAHVYMCKYIFSICQCICLVLLFLSSSCIGSCLYSINFILSKAADPSDSGHSGRSNLQRLCHCLLVSLELWSNFHLSDAILYYLMTTL